MRKEDVKIGMMVKHDEFGFGHVKFQDGFTYLVEFDIPSDRLHSGYDCYRTKHNSGLWFADTEILEMKVNLVEEKIVITTTDKKVVARKYVDNKLVETAFSRCHPEDEFDFNVGARWAFNRLLNMEDERVKPEESKSELKEVKRTAKPGEYIKIVRSTAEADYGQNYKEGDIFKVTRNHDYFKTDVYVDSEKIGRSFICASEYVVLENYKTDVSKLTEDQFMDKFINEKVYVHCESKADFIKFMKMCEKRGLKWRDRCRAVQKIGVYLNNDNFIVFNNDINSMHLSGNDGNPGVFIRCGYKELKLSDLA